MPTTTYIPIATTTLSSTATTVTFSSISQAYRDLIIVINAGNSGNAYNGLWVRVNGDSLDGNYSSTYALGNASSVVSGVESGSSGRLMAGATGSGGSATILQFMDYSVTNKHKTLLSRRAAPDASGYSMGMEVARWASNSAITSLAFSDQSGYTFDAGSTFSLFGVAA